MSLQSLSAVLASSPAAFSDITGNEKAPHMSGGIRIYPWAGGVIVKSELVNIPKDCRVIGIDIDGVTAYPPVSGSGYCLSMFYTDALSAARLHGKKAVVHMLGEPIGTGEIRKTPYGT